MEKNNFINIKNKRFLITGAASGIGLMTALELLKLGCDLILWDTNVPKLKIIKKKKTDNIELITKDLMNFEDIEKIIKNKKFKKIDGFVHCAGISFISPIKNLDEKNLIKTFRINSYAILSLTKNLIKFKKIKKNSSIVLISSIYGLIGSSFNSGYAATKASIHGICKSLAVELAESKIRVNCIAPGFVKTKMLTKNAKLFSENYLDNLTKLHPLGLGKTIDIANLIIYLFSQRSRWITGSIINIDGGYTAK